jgi:hypothetical protein
MLLFITFTLALLTTFLFFFQWINHWLRCFNKYSVKAIYEPFTKEFVYGLLAVLFWSIFYYLINYHYYG